MPTLPLFREVPAGDARAAAFVQRVAAGRDRLRLATEPLEQARVRYVGVGQDLDRDLLVEGPVPAEVDHAHAPGAQSSLQTKVTHLHIGFKAYEERAIRKGFLYVASGPLVRSSYKAAEYYIEGMLRRRREAAGTK